MHDCTYYMLRNRANFLLGGLAFGNTTENSTENSLDGRGEQAEPEAEELGVEESDTGGEKELQGGKKSRPMKSRPMKSRPTLWERLEKAGETLRSDAGEEAPSSLVAPP